jgi:enoyl-CoA hydratase
MNDEVMLRYAVLDGAAWIRIGNEDQGLTLMTTGILALMRQAISEARQDEDVHVLVLTGVGRSFMVGADLAFVRDASVDDFRAFARENQALAAELMTCEKPIVAGINGHALGGGLEIALACDIRLCATAARLGFPEVTIGLLHSTGSSYLLSRLVGLGRAKELVLSGRQLDATEALRIGLVTSVHEANEMEEALRELAERIVASSRPALMWAKRIFDLGASSSFGSALSIEEIGNVACFDTDERVEAANAFFERRAPAFR